MKGFRPKLVWVVGIGWNWSCLEALGHGIPMKEASFVKLSVVLYAWSGLWCMVALFVWARCRKDFFKSFRILDWRTTKHSEQLMLYCEDTAWWTLSNCGSPKSGVYFFLCDSGEKKRKRTRWVYCMWGGGELQQWQGRALASCNVRLLSSPGASELVPLFLFSLLPTSILSDHSPCRFFFSLLDASTRWERQLLLARLTEGKDSVTSVLYPFDTSDLVQWVLSDWPPTWWSPWADTINNAPPFMDDDMDSA
jgi:hypothetical protein